MSYPPAEVLARHETSTVAGVCYGPMSTRLPCCYIGRVAGNGERRRVYAMAYGRSGNDRDPLPVLLDAMRHQAGRRGWPARPRALARLPHQPGETLPEGLDSGGAAAPPGPVDRAVAPGPAGRPAASGDLGGGPGPGGRRNPAE